MTGRRLASVAAALFLAIASLVALPVRAADSAASPATSAAPGGFDFLVFVLSWSPSYCEAADEGAAPEQCGFFARPFGFVVHGLWPQYERGWPEYCLNPPPRLDPGLVASMLDLMPSRRLVEHEWKRHGTCSGLDADGYFELVRQVAALVRIPIDLQQLYTPSTVTPAVIERMFRENNPSLAADEISIACRRRRLTEVRICFDRDLNFRKCPEIERRSCRSDWVLMPAVKLPKWP
jgi:ribonuclease T2